MYIMQFTVTINDKNGSISINTVKPKTIMELAKELEQALPKGEMMVVGNSPTPTKKNIADLKQLISLYDSDCSCGCSCCGEGNMYSEAELDEAYNEGYAVGHSEGYDEGYDKGYDKGYEDAAEECECEEEETEEENLDALAARMIIKVRELLNN
jgi:cell division protein ZapA (FtsZ GTPase activity inhibitor)